MMNNLKLRASKFLQTKKPLAQCMNGAYYSSVKDIKFGDEGRASMAKGVNILARAVAVTLGPKGRSVIIESSYGAPKITKDGVTVAKAITLADKFENLGAKLVQDVANKTNEAAGDGTTTATVLTRAIFVEGLKCIASGVNPTALRSGVQMAVREVIEFLKNNTIKLTTNEQISQVATISANGDVAIGKLIADAMARVGKEGVITVQDGKTIEDELLVTEGMKFDRGFISPYFVTDAKSGKVTFENAYILLSDRKITALQDILPSLELIARERKPLVILAEDVEGEALAALILNKLRGQIQVCAVKAPGFGDHRKAMMEDIAVLTGGQLFQEDLGLKLEKPDTSYFGTVKSVTITKDDTILLNGSGTKESIEERCNMIKEAIIATTSDYEREKLQERLAKLSSGVAVIKVGGVSEVEVGEKKDRVVDALNATRAAVEEGVIPGGGSALIKAVPLLQALMANPSLAHDVKLGIKIVSEAIQAPLKTIVDNAGEQGAVVAGEILKRSTNPADFTFGYNAATSTYVDMIEEGIIDPLKVVRTALSDAAGVASLLTTTEAMIVDAKVETPSPAGGMPGMGGMGGMGGMDY